MGLVPQPGWDSGSVQERPPLAKSAGVRLGALTGCFLPPASTLVADSIREARGAPLAPGPRPHPAWTHGSRPWQDPTAWASPGEEADSGWQDRLRQAVAWEGL